MKWGLNFRLSLVHAWYLRLRFMGFWGVMSKKKRSVPCFSVPCFSEDIVYSIQVTDGGSLRTGSGFRKGCVPFYFYQKRPKPIESNPNRTNSKLMAIIIASLIIICGGGISFQVNAKEKKESTRYFLKENHGWVVCKDLVNSIRRVEPPLASFASEIKFYPKMSQFEFPRWKDLIVEKNMDIIYKIEKGAVPNSLAKNYSYDEWEKKYIQGLSKGYLLRKDRNGKLERINFRPRLRIAHVKFNLNGQYRTVLGYTRQQDAGKQNMAALVECGLPLSFDPKGMQQYYTCNDKFYSKWGKQMDAPGDYIVLYEPDRRQINLIFPAMGGGALSMVSMILFLHDNKGYLANLSVSQMSVSRLKFTDKEHPNITPNVFGQEVCVVNLEQKLDD